MEDDSKLEGGAVGKSILVALRNGDIEAFERVFHCFSDRIYYFALRYIRNQHDAEEIVQEVFLKIWENRNNINEDLSFSGYLFTIARNTIFNQNRKKVNEQAYFEYVKHALSLASNKTEDDLIFSDIQSMVNKVINELPPQRQLVYKMSREKGLSYREIATELSLSERTVEAHIRLALKTITEVVDMHFVIPIVLLLMARML